MDRLSPQERSATMRSIKGKDTSIERIVRSYLFSKGLRFRKNVSYLPGTPDIVLKKWKTVIFVNGCFWHGHERCRYFVLPKSNVQFWENKIMRNRENGEKNKKKLEAMGWKVLTVWECELKTKARRKERLDDLYLEIMGLGE